MRWLIALVWLLLAACTSPGTASLEDPVGEDQLSGCAELIGVYPPESITISAGSTSVVAWSYWSCSGYSADNFTDPTGVPRPPGGTVEILVDFIEPGSSLVHMSGGFPQTTPAPELMDGRGWSLVLPSEVEALHLRLCSVDGRCAGYFVTMEEAPAPQP